MIYSILFDIKAINYNNKKKLHYTKMFKKKQIASIITDSEGTEDSTNKESLLSGDNSSPKLDDIQSQGELEKNTSEIYEISINTIDGKLHNQSANRDSIKLDRTPDCITQTYLTPMQKNDKYSSIKIFFFLLLHSLPSIAFGYNLLIMNPLGSVIFKDPCMEIPIELIPRYIGNVVVALSMGKLAGSLTAGYLIKKIRKIVIIYLGEV